MVDIRKNTFVTIDNNRGEYTATLLVDDVTSDNISGLIISTSSAYGSAVVRDVFETGKRITMDKSDITDIWECTDTDALQKILNEGIKRRNSLTKTFIGDDTKNVIQRISISEDEYSSDIKFTFMATLPNTKDEDGVPAVTESFYYANNDTTEDNVKKAMDNRHRYYSSSGDILSETKIFFKDSQIGTLSKYTFDDISVGKDDEKVIRMVLDTIAEYISQ